MDLFQSTILVSVKSPFNILMGIKVPSHPVSILYLHVVFVWLPFIHSFATITNITLWKLQIFDYTMSKYLVGATVSTVS